MEGPISRILAILCQSQSILGQPSTFPTVCSRFVPMQAVNTITPLVENMRQVWDFNRSAEMRDSEGGASKRSVLEQVDKLKKYLADQH